MQCVIKRYVRDQGENEQPRCILSDIPCVHEPFDQQKAEDGERQPADPSGIIVELSDQLRHVRIGRDCGQPVKGPQHGGSCMIDEHRYDGDHLKRGS